MDKFVLCLLLFAFSIVGYTQSPQQQLTQYTEELQLGLSGNDNLMVINAIEGMRRLGVEDARLDFFEGRARLNEQEEIVQANRLLQTYINANPTGQYVDEAMNLVNSVREKVQVALTKRFNTVVYEMKSGDDPLKQMQGEKDFYSLVDEGSLRAMEYLAWRLLHGIPLHTGMRRFDMDEEKAWEIYGKIIEYSETVAWEIPDTIMPLNERLHILLTLGMAYQYGWGVSKDFTRALQYYQLARPLVDKSDKDEKKTELYHQIAELFAFGEGVEQNCDAAQTYLELTAANGAPSPRMIREDQCIQNAREDWLYTNSYPSRLDLALLIQTGHMDGLAEPGELEDIKSTVLGFEYMGADRWGTFYTSQRYWPEKQTRKAIAAFNLAQLMIQGRSFFRHNGLKQYLEMAVAGGIDGASVLLEKMGPVIQVESEAEKLKKEDKWEEALELYNDALKSSYDPYLQYASASIAYRKKEFDRFEAGMKRIIENDPEYYFALVRLGSYLLESTDRIDEAEFYIREANKLNYWQSRMGRVLFKQGKLDEAFIYLKSIGETDGSGIQNKYTGSTTGIGGEDISYLAEIYTAQGNKEEACELMLKREDFGKDGRYENEIYIKTLRKLRC